METEISQSTGQGNTTSGAAEYGGNTAMAGDNAATTGESGVQRSTGEPSVKSGAVVTGELPREMEHLADRTLRLRTESGHGPGRNGNTDTAAPAEGVPGMGSGGAEIPLTDPSDLELSFPDGLHVDEGMADSYRQFCVDCGLTPAQSQHAADFYFAELGRRMAQEKEETLTSLREGAWAGRFDDKLAKANYATHVLDRQLGGRLRPLLATGLGNNGVFAEMMAVIGEAVSEDAFSAQPGVYAGSHRMMTTEEYLRTEVFKD